MPDPTRQAATDHQERISSYLEEATWSSVVQRHQLMGWVGVLGWSTFLVQHLLTARFVWIKNDLVAIAVNLLLAWWSRSGGRHRVRLAAHLGLLCNTISIGWTVPFSGEQHAVGYWFMATLPVAASFVLGTRAGLAWSAIQGALLLALDAAPAFFPQGQPYIAVGYEIPFSHVLVLVILTGFAYVTRSESDRLLRQLAERNVLVEEQILILHRQASEVALARDAAVASAQARTELVASLSHEIRTPLNGLVGIASLLPRLRGQRDESEWLRLMERSTGQLLEVVNNVLDFSKAEVAPLDLEHIAFDLATTLREVIQLQATLASEKSIDLCFVDETPSGWAHGDPVRLHQVASNLVANAIKFTEHGHVLVTLRHRAGEGFHIEVEDTGLGLDPTQADRLFEPFTQAAASTTRLYGGTGLGLAICDRVVRAMGGHIKVRSTVGHGATFDVLLPLEEAPASNLSTEASATSAPLPPSADGAPLRAYVFAPRTPTTTYLDRLLRELGMVVLHPSEHSDLGGHSHVHLVVLSASLPTAEMHALLHKPALARVPRLLVASLGERRFRPRTEELGFGGVLEWPLQPRQVRHAVRRALLEPAPPAPPVETPTLSAGASQALRVLLADDHPINRKVALLMLKKLGLEADYVEDGLHVLAALRGRDYDVVLMDMQMPGLDGVQATRQVRAELPAARQPRIIALTANSLHHDEFTAAGADDFLEKPVTLQMLKQAIERVTRTSPERLPGSPPST